MEFDSGLFTQIIILFVLVALNAFFASSEIAIISLNDKKIKKMAEEGHKKAQIIEKLVSEPSRFLATIQIGITLAGLLASAFAAESFGEKLTSIIVSTGLPIDASIIKFFSLILITLLLSYFQLVMGELVPKRLAMQKPEEISMFAAKPISILSKIANPFIRFLTASTNFVIKIFGGNPNFNEEIITEEEIRMMVDAGEEKGVIQGTEKEMIDNIFEFDDTLVSEVMTHRTDVVAIPVNSSARDALKIIIREKYTRIPVFDETIDDIIGTIHVKDILKYFDDNDNIKDFDLKKAMRKPYFVPESKKTDELLKDLQKNKVHMAIVVDEYGGTAGLITIEDLIEQIVGNIFDEYDEEEKEIEKLDECTYLINGTADLELVKDQLEVELPTEDYDTLSGFVVGQLGRIPTEADEMPEIEYNGLLFKVQEIEEKRISKIKVCKV